MLHTIHKCKSNCAWTAWAGRSAKADAPCGQLVSGEKMIGKPATPLTRNASDVASELIREAILAGRLAPGARLKEQELAQALGISRTPVREALLLLQAEGLIESSPNRGAMVRAYSSEELTDMYELRALLEGHAARLAASRITKDDVSALADSCKRFRKQRLVEDTRGLTTENLFFHFTIVRTSGSPKLVELVQSIIQVPLVASSFGWYSKHETRRSEDFHKRIVTALRAGDEGRAERLMKEHIFDGRDYLIARVESAAPDDARGLAAFLRDRDGSHNGADGRDASANSHR